MKALKSIRARFEKGSGVMTIVLLGLVFAPGCKTDAEAQIGVGGGVPSNPIQNDSPNDNQDSEKIAKLEQDMAALQTLVSNLDSTVQNQRQQISKLEEGPSILGTTQLNFNGKINVNGKHGVAGADEACKQQFSDEPNAHFCTIPEIQVAVNRGNFPDNLVANDTWTIPSQYGLFFPSDSISTHNTLKNSCNYLTTNAGDVANGTTVRVDIDMIGFGAGGSGMVAPAVIVRPNRPCPISLPVMCCR